MRLKWGNNKEILTIEAEDGYDLRCLALIERQVTDRIEENLWLKQRIAHAQKKMHEKCNEVIELRKKLKNKTITGWFQKLLNIGV